MTTLHNGAQNAIERKSGLLNALNSEQGSVLLNASQSTEGEVLQREAEMRNVLIARHWRAFRMRIWPVVFLRRMSMR